MDAQFVGRTGKCPRCGQLFKVPMLGVVSSIRDSQAIGEKSQRPVVSSQPDSIPLEPSPLAKSPMPLPALISLNPLDGLAPEPKRKPPFLNRRTQLILGLASAIILGFIGIAFVGSYFGYWDSPNSKQLSIEELQQQVFQSIQADFATRGVQAVPNSLGLVHEQGNIYDGVLKCTSDGAPLNIKVKVTYDGNTSMWETEQ
jgi:hypothetical protein